MVYTNVIKIIHINIYSILTFFQNLLKIKKRNNNGNTRFPYKEKFLFLTVPEKNNSLATFPFFYSFLSISHKF